MPIAPSRTFALAAAGVLWAASLAQAQSAPQILTSFTDPMGPQARAITPFQSGVFFSTNSAINGGLSGLWKSDGTPAGTFRFKSNLIVETQSPLPTDPDPRMRPVNVGGFIYFVGYSGQFNDPHALYRTDGTSQGTVELRRFSIQPTIDTWPNALIGAGDKLIFAVNQAIWVSRGTPSSTILLRDFTNPGGIAPSLQGFTTLGDSVIFSTGAGSPMGDAPGLWRTDGTVAGTIQFKPNVAMDLQTVTEPGNRRPVALNGVVYFSGFETSNINPPGPVGFWRTDGTADGTFEVSRFGQFPAIAISPRSYTAVGNQVYFVVGSGPQSIWRSAGTTETTRQVYAPQSPTATLQFSGLTDLDGMLLFSANVGAGNDPTGLYRSNGDADSTFRFRSDVVFDTSTFNTFGGSDADKTPLSVGATTFFSGTSPNAPGTGAVALWRTDGTARGTYQLASFIDPTVPGGIGQAPDNFIYNGGRLFLRAGGNLYAFKPQICPADFNADGTVDPDDLADFIALYFSPCP